MKDSIEDLIVNLIDAQQDKIYEFCEDIFTHGEQGFHEVRTARKFEEFLNYLGIQTVNAIALTGVKGEISNEEGPSVALISELDGIVCPSHPKANENNGVSHACGHHIQMGAVLGAAAALSNKKVLEHMKGNIAFFGVPAEEFIDSNEKERLRTKEGIRYSSSGKSEFIRIGQFDTVDIALTHHVHMTETDKDLLLGSSSTNGFIAKKIVYKGRASHAANSPELGINALNAAMIGLNAAAYQREMFRDNDSIRVHSIIKNGGGPVNVIPDEVEVETLVRANNLEAMKSVSKKTDRAFRAGAYALEAEVEITDYPGYLPVPKKDPEPCMINAVKLLSGEITYEHVNPSDHSAASTDVGDLAHLMPVLHFTSGGFTGTLHSADFAIEDRYKAYIIPAKVMALTVYHLLRNDAEDARRILKNFKPELTKEGYISFKEGNI